MATVDEETIKNEMKKNLVNLKHTADTYSE